MLKRRTAEPYDDQVHPYQGPEPGPSDDILIDYERLLAAARRQARLFIICSILGLAAGVGYLKSAVREYTATASLLVDSQKIRAVEEAYQAITGTDMNASYLDTQMELLGSDPIVFSVIDKLQLLNDPEFSKDSPTFLSLVLSSFRAKPEAAKSTSTDTNLRRHVADFLKARVEIRRLARTPILQIMCKSQDPDKAAKIANGFASAYLADQLDAKYDSTRRVSTWLQERIAELKERVLVSDLALQKFKAENQLITSSGKLVNEQQLTEVNTQLVNARAETAQAAARYQRTKAVRDNKQTDAIVAGAIASPVIDRLRQSYLNALKRESELLPKVGADHASVVNLRQEAREYEKLMFQELGRIEEAYLSEFEIARSREKSLEVRLAGLVGSTASTNKTLVTLRELERESDSYKTLYQSMLQRNQEVLQAQSIPVSESRLVVAAWSPDVPSSPKTFSVLGLALLLGAGFGISLGVIREFRDRALRTAQQVREELHLELLGMLPFIDRSSKGRASSGQLGGKLTKRLPARMRYVSDHPLSDYAEGLGAVKLAADLTLARRACKRIGIVSILPGEGKTTVVSNFALLLAQLGMRTLLVDADLRNPQLTRLVVGEVKEGIASAALNPGSAEDVLLRDENLPLVLLPAASRKTMPHTWAILTSPGTEKLLNDYEEHFDFILFDLPPMGPVVDASAFAPKLDGIIVVVEWGSTARKLVQTTLNANPRVRDRCIGVILNKVDMKKLNLYVGYESKEYYRKKYEAYFR